MTDFQLSIRWKDMTKQDQMKEYLEEKLTKLFDFSFVESNIKVEYVYYKSKQEYKFRLNAKIHRGEVLRSEATASDIKTATNLGIDKMIDQLRRIKTKVNSNKESDRIKLEE